MDDDVKQLLGRARAPVRKAVRETPDPPRDRRHVYGGDPPRSSTAAAGPRQNTKVVRRPVSTFNTIIMLFGGGILIVLYVHNIITINRLAADTGALQARYEQVQNVNASLRAEVNRKSAWERIGKTATEQLGLIFPTEQALNVTIDRDALARAREQGNDESARTRQSDGRPNAESSTSR